MRDVGRLRGFYLRDAVVATRGSAEDAGDVTAVATARLLDQR